MDLSSELKVFSRNDVLVNIGLNPKINLDTNQTTFKSESNSDLNKIFKIDRQTFKETGVRIFCLSSGVLHWEWKGLSCESPILLCPAQINFNKITQSYSISFDPDETFVNPFLVVEFQKTFDFGWPQMPFFEMDWKQLALELQNLGFKLTISNETHCGNFHHHRYKILKDVEQLEGLSEFSQPLNQILLIQDDPHNAKMTYAEQNLYPADNDQQLVFKKFQQSSIVVQGPPGTGKSQVISNLIGKLLHSGQSNLVVSEKRVALEVLLNKMATFNLDKFCFLPGTNNPAQALLLKLKETWLFLESCDTKAPFQLYLSKEKRSGLQFKLEVLSKADLIGGISFSAFQKLSAHLDLNTANYNRQSADISDFLTQKLILKNIYDIGLFELLGQLPFHILRLEAFDNLITNINKLEHKYTILKREFDVYSKAELYLLMKKASFAQLISNEQSKDYFSILQPDSSDRKKFTRLEKKFFFMKFELKNLEQEKNNWKIEPSEEETIVLLETMSRGTLIRKYKLSRRLKQLLASSFVPAQQSLTNWLTYIQLKKKFEKIEKQLLEIGISNENDISWLKNILPQITAENWQNWSAEHKTENEKLANSNAQINSFYQDLRVYLKLEDGDSIEKVFCLFEAQISNLVAHREVLILFGETLYNQVGKQNEFENLEKEIFKSSWLNFVGTYPAFANFSWADLTNSLNEIIDLEHAEALDFSIEISVELKNKFDKLNTLIQTPNRNLSDEDKLRKATLKKGRSLLIKEFAKTRSHPTIRELLESPASQWIETILPIWMVNPSQVADFFPLKLGLFENVLFDEATQIPFVNSLGALYRSKRTLVVGDEQQMTPTSFFKSGESEPMDLLHQARFTWEKVMLKHHYRSQHPDLIAFSNKHFYNNQLIAYPNALNNNSVLQIHHIKEGRFLNRQNKQEALAVAKFIAPLLFKNESIGIVAFSETQLSCIYEHLSFEAKQMLDERLEQNTCFFRALENIQGDECDHLIISLGYGLNEADKLILNFGPLNRQSGRRRLNVLFSRARQKIDFFTSIQSSDLTLSENDALNLLRQFFLQLENYIFKKEYQFPYDLHFSTEKSTITNNQVVKIYNVVEQIRDANELVTLQRVLSTRNWHVHYN